MRPSSSCPASRSDCSEHCSSRWTGSAHGSPARATDREQRPTRTAPVSIRYSIAAADRALLLVMAGPCEEPDWRGGPLRTRNTGPFGREANAPNETPAHTEQALARATDGTRTHDLLHGKQNDE